MNKITLTLGMVFALWTAAAAAEKRINVAQCSYSGQALKVPASDYFLKIVEQTSTKDVCLRKVLCVNPAPIQPYPGYIPQYETYVGCLPDAAGRCTQAYENCKEDNAVDFVDRKQANEKIRKDLNIKDVPAAR